MNLIKFLILFYKKKKSKIYTELWAYPSLIWNSNPKIQILVKILDNISDFLALYHQIIWKNTWIHHFITTLVKEAFYKIRKTHATSLFSSFMHFFLQKISLIRIWIFFYFIILKNWEKEREGVIRARAFGWTWMNKKTSR